MNSPSPQKPQTNWFIWSLHFVLGLIIGGSIGLLIGFRMMRFALIWHRPTDYWELGSIMLGVGLIVGGMASYKGNRFWFKPSLWDPAEPVQGRNSHILSVGLGMAGVVISATTVVRFLGKRPSSGSGLGGLMPVWLILTGLLLFVLIFAWRERMFPGSPSSQPCKEEDFPLVFWMIFALIGLGLLVLVWGLYVDVTHVPPPPRTVEKDFHLPEPKKPPPF